MFKKKEKTEKAPKNKKVRTMKVGTHKKSVLLLWAVLLASTSVGVYKNFTAIDTHTVHEKEIIQLRLNDTNGIENFVKNFAKAYYSWDTSKEAIEARTTEISKYLTKELQDLNADTIRTDIPTSVTVTNVLVWNVEQSGTDDFTVAYEVDQQVKEGEQTQAVPFRPHGRAPPAAAHVGVVDQPGRRLAQPDELHAAQIVAEALIGHQAHLEVRPVVPQVPEVGVWVFGIGHALRAQVAQGLERAHVVQPAVEHIGRAGLRPDGGDRLSAGVYVQLEPADLLQRDRRQPLTHGRPRLPPPLRQRPSQWQRRRRRGTPSRRRGPGPRPCR